MAPNLHSLSSAIHAFRTVGGNSLPELAGERFVVSCLGKELSSALKISKAPKFNPIPFCSCFARVPINQMSPPDAKHEDREERKIITQVLQLYSVNLSILITEFPFRILDEMAHGVLPFHVTIKNFHP